MTTTKILMMLTLMLSLMVSCGKDDDNGDTNVQVTPPATPANEEEPTTPRPRRPTCLSNTQRNNITNFLTRLSSFGNIVGIAEEEQRGEIDSTIVTFDTTYTISSETPTAWIVSRTQCESGTVNCTNSSSRAEFRDGCFYVDDNRARIQSSTSSRLRFTTSTTDEGNRITEAETFAIAPNGKVTARNTLSTKGRTFYILKFDQN